MDQVLLAHRPRSAPSTRRRTEQQQQQQQRPQSALQDKLSRELERGRKREAILEERLRVARAAETNARPYADKRLQRENDGGHPSPYDGWVMLSEADASMINELTHAVRHESRRYAVGHLRRSPPRRRAPTIEHSHDPSFARKGHQPVRPARSAWQQRTPNGAVQALLQPAAPEHRTAPTVGGIARPAHRRAPPAVHPDILRQAAMHAEIAFRKRDDGSLQTSYGSQFCDPASQQPGNARLDPNVYHPSKHGSRSVVKANSWRAAPTREETYTASLPGHYPFGDTTMGVLPW